MADPDALRFTSELMLRTKGSCDFWTCSVDSAERLAIRVLTTTAPAQCAVGSAQARNQLVHGQCPGNKLHGDRFVSRLSSFECCHSTLRCGAAPTHRNGAHSNTQRMLPTAGAPFAVQLSRGECMASVLRRFVTVVCDAVRCCCREAGIRISRDDQHRECAPAATRPGPGAEQHPFGADDLVSRPVIIPHPHALLVDQLIRLEFFCRNGFSKGAGI